jgi:hypothetical protein
MIRFINLTGQISGMCLPKENQTPCIAYYDTVIDRFLEVDGEQTFSSLEDFEKWVGEDSPEWSQIDWDRLRSLTPKEFLT